MSSIEKSRTSRTTWKFIIKTNLVAGIFLLGLGILMTVERLLNNQALSTAYLSLIVIGILVTLSGYLGLKELS